MSSIAADTNFCWVHPNGTGGLGLTVKVVSDTGVSAGTFTIASTATDNAVYTGTFPTSITAGHYCCTIRQTSGGTFEGYAEVDWMGTNDGYLVSNAHIYDLLLGGLVSDVYLVGGGSTTSITLSASTAVAPLGSTYSANDRKNFTSFTVLDVSTGEYHTRNIDDWTYVLSTVATITWANDPRGALPFTPTNGDRLYLHSGGGNVMAAADNDSVDSNVIADSTLTAAKIASGAITSAKFAASAITSTVLANGAITSAKFATAVITATVLASNAITAAKIANNAITAGALAANTITSDKIQTGAITAAKIDTAAINVDKIADGTITAAKLATDAITAAKIADDALTAAKFATDSITADAIADGSIDAATFAADALEAIAADVWDYLTADSTVVGSFGVLMQSIFTSIGNIAITGSAVSDAPDSIDLTTGTVVTGTVADVVNADGVYYQLTDDGGTILVDFNFNIGGDGIPTSVELTGRLNGANDTLDIEAYNWNAAAFEKIGEITGTGGSTDESISRKLLARHVGTGVNLGDVEIRLTSSSLTTATFYLDQALVAYSIANRSVGYALGAIWIDTTGNGTAGTESFVNGTADRPVDSLADALTIAGNLNLRRLFFLQGSSVTLPSTFDGWSLLGNGWTLALGGQQFENNYIQGADSISGTTTGTGPNVWDSCGFANASVGPGTWRTSGFAGTLTLTGDGTYLFNDCRSDVAGTGTPTFDHGGHNVQANFRNWSGGQQHDNIDNASSRVSCDLDPGTCFVNATCDSVTADAVNIRGTGRAVDNSPNQIANVTSLVKADQLDQLFYGRKVSINTESATTGTAFPAGTPGEPVNNVTDARTIADNVGTNGIQAYEIIGSITLAAAHEDWLFSGIGGSNSFINVGGQNVAGSQFISMNVQGTIVTETDIVEVRKGPIGNMAGFRGSVVECGIFGTWSFGTAANTNRFVRCQQGNTTPQFDCTNLNTTAIFALYDGAIEFDNLSAGQTIILNSSGGASITFGAGCTGGNVILRGIYEYTDNSGNVTIDDDLQVGSSADTAAAVWAALATGSLTADSFGQALKDLLDIFSNRSDVTENMDGSKTIEFYRDDASTVFLTLDLTADGLNRTVA